jgi:hypothetical protein
MRGLSAAASLASLWLAVACRDDARHDVIAQDASPVPDAASPLEPRDAASRDGEHADGCAPSCEAGARMDARPTDAAASKDASGGPGPLRDAEPDRAVAADASRSPAHEEAGPPPGYPPPPYGTTKGDVLPYLRWQGYVGAEDGPDAGLVSDQTWKAYSSDDLRTSGKTLALLHVSDFDCPGCRRAALHLGASGLSVVAAGGLVVEVLASQAFAYTPATRTALDAWVTSYDLKTTSLIDRDAPALATFHAVGVRDTALVVSLPDMHVLWRETGDLSGVTPTSAEDAMTEMLLRLGK